MPLQSVAPTQRWQLDCPDCKAEKVHDVTHLIPDVVKKGAAGYDLAWGWCCKKCGVARGFKLFWQGDQLYVQWGEFSAERTVRPNRAWVLMKLDGKLVGKKTEEDVYFLLDVKGLHLSRYWFEEHTCPTNFIGDTDEIFIVDPKKDRVGSDPHGLFRVVGWLPHDGVDHGSSPNPQTEMWQDIMERIRKGEPHGLNPMWWSQTDEHSPYDDIPPPEEP